MTWVMIRRGEGLNREGTKSAKECNQNAKTQGVEGAKVFLEILGVLGVFAVIRPVGLKPFLSTWKPRR